MLKLYQKRPILTFKNQRFKREKHNNVNETKKKLI